ncbi:CARDB domain-containing protein [Paenibacillus plantiphilus]|uniref:CARDB domain-containing protein n=1 Tax=Paenibacillus plantiphilus TaxID=2905650 RepID=UPI001F3E668D|nr:CARDB domain-containing protein [Paenibacillus plantiphilus]
MTQWIALTYIMEFEIDVTYERIVEPTQPDLVAIDIVSAETPEIGKTSTFKAQYRNEGPAINKSFNLKVLDETGAQLHLSTLSSVPSNSSTRDISFDYKFTSAAKKTFRFIVDSANSIDEESESNNEVSKEFKPGDPGTKTFTGDFDIDPNKINYRDSFTLIPKDFLMNGCTYQSHSFKIERGITWTGPEVYGHTKDSTFTHSTYPSIIGVGSHNVYMTIKTSCGEKVVGPKPLVVQAPDSDNNPPQFQIAFVRPEEPTKPVHHIVEGTKLDLIVIQNPSIPTPSDPDGDRIFFDEFFFSQSQSSWIRSLPTKYPVHDWAMLNITMEKGFHNISAQIRDEWGLTAQSSTYINVVSKNPVAVLECPPFVIENHPVPDSAFNSSRSYSPIGKGIKHSRDEWTNKNNSYTNGTSENITVTVSLDVYDTDGLKSESPATCTIIVKPDLPPIAKLKVPSLGIRNEPSVILNESYSPDGDEIVLAEYKYKYDAKNNGFADDAWQSIDGKLQNVVINPPKVGKYLFYVKVTENYGKAGDTSAAAESTLILDVVNNAPEVSFEVEGKNPQPDLDASTTVRVNDMLNWPVYVTNSHEQVFNKSNLWHAEGGSLVGGEGRNFGDQGDNIYKVTGYMGSRTFNSFPLINNGFGTNRLSPWRAATSFNTSLIHPLIDNTGNIIKEDQEAKLRSNKKLFYFQSQLFTSTNGIYALDPKRLSPVESYIDDKTRSLKHRYKNGSPYAFVIRNKGQILDWDIADQYLYILDMIDVSINLRVHNAYTGALLKEKTMIYDLGRGDMNGWSNWKIDHTKGSNVMLRSDYSTSMNHSAGIPVTKWIELTPDLTLTNKPDWTIPAPRGPYINNHGAKYKVGKLFRDPYGNLFAQGGFASRNGNIDQYYDLSVTKYNPDLTVAWRTYMTPPSELGYPTRGSLGGYGSMYDFDSYIGLAINPFKAEVAARFYQNRWEGMFNFPTDGILVLDMHTGALKQRYSELQGDSVSAVQFDNYYVDWNGNSAAGKGSVTVEGHRTDFGSVYSPSGSLISKLEISNAIRYGEYFGDGFYVFFTELSEGYYGINAVAGTPSTAPIVRKAYTNGQFMSNLSLNDAEMRFSLRMVDIPYDNETMGFSFRMQDPKNRYAVETDGTSFNLVKYVNGQQTVLQTGSYAFESDKSYGMRIKAVGDEIEVFLNNIPILSAKDGAYSEGRFGYYSDKSFVRFSSLTYKAVRHKVEWSDSYAIWDEGTATADVAYKNILFLDPEGDPKAGSYRWSIQHTPRFINNGGVSALNGQTFDSERLGFDKVGDYQVTLRAKDDPHPDYLTPDMTFDNYRKNSNPFMKQVTVHRRPISKFTVVPAADGKLIWSDSSFDPDRYESSTKYSTEATGLDYLRTKGIVEKKFFYTTPSGATIYEKLVTPQEKGPYDIGLAVKDEYGAWSDYTVVTLDVSSIATPNTPPVPGFTTSHINTFRNVPITINSTAYDAEDGGRQNLPHEYYIRNMTTGGAESIQSTSRTNWSKTFSSLGSFTIRQIVTDSAGAEAQFSRQVNIVNHKPVAQITVPESVDQNNPTKLTELRPAFMWSYSDADNDPQTRYELKLYRYGGMQLFESGVKPGASLNWRPSVDLPEHVPMYVIVRTYDGYDWSEWSAPKYFYIETNRPPTADFDWLPKPVYEGDMIRVSHALDDPDRDMLSVSYKVTDPDGMEQSFAYHVNQPYSTTGPVFRGAEPGGYKVEQMVSDGKAPAVVVVKTITVLPLKVEGQVDHTALWNERRKSFNNKESGTDNSPRGYDVFWAGEKFVLASGTTATGTATRTEQVEVTMGGFSVDMTPSNAAGTSWTGEMWDESFEHLPDGPLIFTFTATYSNGTIKTTTVPIAIRGNIQQTVGVHRRQ